MRSSPSPAPAGATSDMSTTQTSVLIVGAGPSGLAAALSLVKSGFRDFIIVDAATVRPQASRAMTVHAATIEVPILFATIPSYY